MINSNFKELTNRYESINFDFSFNNNEWRIVVKNKFTNDEEFSDINEDSDDIYYILKELLEGHLLCDYQDEIIGEDNNECFSFVKEKNKIILYSGKIFQEFIQITEDEFSNELDFYIKVFQDFETIDLTHNILKENRLMTPLELFVSHIKNKGYTLKGFKHCGADNDGYVDYLMIIEDSDGKLLEIDYPQKDGVYGVFDGLTKPDDISIISYQSAFIKLLVAIRDNTIQNYFDNH